MGNEYELSMVVSYVKGPMETRGNLVAHIKVGSTYHMRKEVRGVVAIVAGNGSSCNCYAGPREDTVVPVQ